MAVRTHYNAIHNGYTYQETYNSITGSLYRGILLNDKEVTSASCRIVTGWYFIDYIPSSLDEHLAWVLKYWKDMDKSSLDLLNRKKSMDKHSEKDKSQYTDCDKSYGTKCKFNVGSNRCSNKDVTGGLLQFSTCPYFQKKEVKKITDRIVGNDLMDNKNGDCDNWRNHEMENIGNSLTKELVDEMKINNEINRKCLQGLKEIQEMIEKQKLHDVTDIVPKALPMTWEVALNSLLYNVNEQ